MTRDYLSLVTQHQNMARTNCGFSERIILLFGFSFISWLFLLIRLEIRQLNELGPIVVQEPLPYIEYFVNCPSVSEGEIRKNESLPRYSKYLTSHYYAIVRQGGLGNQLFELISMIGIATSLGRTPVLSATDPSLMREIATNVLYKFPDLIEQFQTKIIDISLYGGVPFNDMECCRYTNVSVLEEFANYTVLKLDGVYFQSYKYFHFLRPQIRKWLVPPWKVLRKASFHLRPDHLNDTVICTHIRRGDFMDDGVHKPSGAYFTRRATDYVAKKHRSRNRNTTVVVLGNDPLWAQSIFRDALSLDDNKEKPYNVIITPTMSPEVDIAFSARHCDAVLITAPSSTFGWWLAYLAKEGATVYYRDIAETEDKVINEMTPDDFYPPDWIKLQTAGPSVISTTFSLDRTR